VVDAVHKRLARSDMLGLKIPHSPKYHEVTLDFTDYAASILHPENLAADRGAKDTGPRVGVLHVVWHAKVNEVSFRVLRGESHALVVTKFTLQFSAVNLSPPLVRHNSPRRGAENMDIVTIREDGKVRVFHFQLLQVRVNSQTVQERAKATTLAGSHGVEDPLEAGTILVEDNVSRFTIHELNEGIY
jgi:hypothetical protein